MAPKKTRYSNASTDLSDIDESETPDHSPAAVPMTMNSAPPIHRAATSQVKRTNQERDADEPEQQAGDHSEAGPRPTGTQPLQHHDPERHGGNEKRGKPGRHPLLCPDDPTVTANEEQHGEHGRHLPMHAFRTGSASAPGPPVENGASQQEPDACHQERR